VGLSSFCFFNAPHDCVEFGCGIPTQFNKAGTLRLHGFNATGKAATCLNQGISLSLKARRAEMFLGSVATRFGGLIGHLRRAHQFIRRVVYRSETLIQSIIKCRRGSLLHVLGVRFEGGKKLVQIDRLQLLLQDLYGGNRFLNPCAGVHHPICFDLCSDAKRRRGIDEEGK